MTIDRTDFNAEDFLIDSSFQQYCAGTDALSIRYWEQYIAAHPEQKAVIEEARRLYRILSGNKPEMNARLAAVEKKMDRRAGMRLLGNTWFRAAAVFLILASGMGWYLGMRHQAPDVYNEAPMAVYTTSSGERKKIVLPDGTVVLLNAQSRLSVRKAFNGTNRDVLLNGEGFFSVAHNRNKPFNVYTGDLKVKVLGTEFNVKAYDNDASSEVTLLKGAVTMETTQTGNAAISLKPGQKIVYNRKRSGKNTETARTGTGDNLPEMTLYPYTLTKDSTILETAWTQNRIVIQDQELKDVKELLEKWYGVEIVFDDPDIGSYRFTAVFINETIEQALTALQQAKSFKYSIQGNKITITK
ncbi:FecR domain-containing protein [Niabella pedocola]|uniref:FecR domain-containing protein n=1 Tax=Niabella pedocola TaxID=1752077 RepID=A0ABS8PW28_9BACT|nr:FecR domain-containing protein [Niabella pedocola]MCD2425268.1 FecR domain-containing protein [Niabella pedocola]